MPPPSSGTEGMVMASVLSKAMTSLTSPCPCHLSQVGVQAPYTHLLLIISTSSSFTLWTRNFLKPVGSMCFVFLLLP